MDQKTLEYMGQRVQRGKELTDAIATCKMHLDMVSRSNGIYICTSTGHTLHFGLTYKSLKELLSPSIEQAIEQHIEKLQAEFDAL